MKAFFLLTILLCLVSCTHHINIIKVDSAFQDDYILLKVVTNEDLREYENSNWAYCIGMSYNVIQTKKQVMNNHTFPFMAKNICLGKQIKDSKNYMSKWKIPFKNKIGISGNSYFYDFSKNNENCLRIIIDGATMGGTRVETQPFTVNLEPNQ